MDALEMTLLFDYYGELLTDRQKACLDMRYNQDMSLGEIAQELGVSRQGVHDTLMRAEALLHNIEEKTGCVKREMDARRRLQLIQAAAEQLQNHPDESVSLLASQILRFASEAEE